MILARLRSRQHPAVQAWRQVCSKRAEPSFIEPLQQARNCVYRLHDVGPSGAAVIAKRCMARYAQVEQAVYQDILPHLPISSLTFYGCVDEPESEYSWLFLEDAGGGEFVNSIKEHRRLAARWLGQLHVSAACLPAVSRLPDIGPRHYLNHLRAARESIQGNLGDPTLNSEEIRALEAVLSQVHLLECRWNRIEERFRRFARTLVHGEYVKAHVRVRSSAWGSDFIVFDWGKAGYGIPALDIVDTSGRGGTRSSVETELVDYWSVVRESWSDLDVSAIKELADVGAVLRLVLGISWDSRDIGRRWWRIEGLHSYQVKLAVALERLGLA